MDFFPIIILNARPGSGKSEIIDFLQKLPLEERIARFHIGSMHVLDDFPMLWTWFEEDRLLETVFNRSRLHTTPDNYFLLDDYWHLLIERLSLDYEKWKKDGGAEATVIIEFSRGSAHGGYHRAYKHLSADILEQAAALYIRVSFEESLRKNRQRYNADRPHSILEHGLPDEKLTRLYRKDDWDEFSAADPEFLQLPAQRVPYVVMENEDDVTSRGGTALEGRLQTCLDQLWSLYQKRPVRS